MRSSARKRKFNGTTADIISHSRVGQNGWMEFNAGKRRNRYVRMYLVPRCTVAASRIQHEQAGNVAGKKARESDIFHQSLAHFSAHMNSGFSQIALHRISSVLTLQI